MCLGIDFATTYNTFVSKLDINMKALLDNVQANKRVNGGGNLPWADVVAERIFQTLIRINYHHDNY